MWKEFLLYCRLVTVAFGSQLQYRSSFIMLLLAQVLSGITEMVVPWALFTRFKVIQGWTLKEMALLYGMVHMGFGLAEIVSRGFEKFDQIVHRGDFDRFLLRPLGTLVQVATSELLLIKIGRFLQGLFVFVWGLSQMDFSLSAIHIMIVVSCLIGTSSLFYGLFVLQATLAFYLRETLEIMHICTYGTRAVGGYPIPIFTLVWRLFFTYIIPIGSVLYYPISSLLDKGFPLWIGLFVPSAGIVFLLLSFRIWEIGVAHYYSTGS